MTLAVSDVLNDVAATTGTISGCTGTGVSYSSGTLTLAAGATAVCAYSASPAGRTATLNTATATIAGVGFSGTASITWTPTIVNPSVTLDDDQNPDFPVTVSDDATYPYSDSYTCSTDVADYTDGTYQTTDPNTATISAGATLLDSASATETINCYIPTVSKTADGSFDRAWDWTITKGATDGISTTPLTSLDLMPGQSFLVTYNVRVNASKTDNHFDVGGTITVSNPNPTDAMTVDVTDHLGTPSADLAATDIACNTDGNPGTDEDGDDVVISAGETIVCTYAFSNLSGVVAGQSGTNTAKATLGTVQVTATDGYTYAIDTETDECTTVTDTNAVTSTNPTGRLGTVCATDTLPRTFSYDVLINGPTNPLDCGTTQVPNTATSTTNDSGTIDTAVWTIDVNIHCQDGCTLTQGYWKTHSSYGPAPTDEAWMLLPDMDGDGVIEGPDESFYLSGQTWYAVFWTKPAGNAYYILAKQYMAAVLNGVNGASTTSITTALADAEALFEQYTPADIAKMKGKHPVRAEFISLADTLTQYNEGLIGPGHCDEDRLSSRAA